MNHSTYFPFKVIILNNRLYKLDDKDYDYPKDWIKDKPNQLFTHLQIRR